MKKGKSVLLFLSLVLIAFIFQIAQVSAASCITPRWEQGWGGMGWEDCAAWFGDECYNKLHAGDDSWYGSETCRFCCINSCIDGYSNCDGKWSNGCETSGGCCAQSCKTASTVACGGSLDSGNGCSSGCSSNGGTYCASGTCISGSCCSVVNAVCTGSVTASYTCGQSFALSGTCTGSSCTGTGTYCASGTCISGSCCAQSCKVASTVACGGSLDSGNGCSSTCSATGGTYCATGTCVSGTCKNINQPYWTNLANSNPITNSQLGDTVRMVAAGSGFNLGQQINYTIYKTSGFWIIRWVTPLSSILSSDLWTTDVAEDRVYFKARMGNLENTSSSINIGLASNAQPVAVITAPLVGLRAAINSPISFTQASYDEDDLLNVSWNFGDGNITSYYNYSLISTPALANTQHTYTSGGVYNIKLTASEMTRSNSDSYYMAVYVLQPGINVMPVITSPNPNQVYTNWVTFNASQSFVANCTRGPRTGSIFTVGDLNCSYIHAPGKRGVSGYNLGVTWTVKEGDNSTVRGFPISGSWEQNYTTSVEFSKYFATAAKRYAYLTLDYSN